MSDGESSVTNGQDEDSLPPTCHLGIQEMSPLETLTDLKQAGADLCFDCGDLITERFLLQVSGRSWHIQCLRCCICDEQLDCQPSCYIKNGQIYCKFDYCREFGNKCGKCSRIIHSNDWVRRAKDRVYHLACFACDNCKRQLSTGEEFALTGNKLLCKTHYLEHLQGGGDRDNEYYADIETSNHNRTKRVRTTFTEEQLQVLQANFQVDSNPDGQELERIAQITGLSKRVTQVWFQNSRARQKKHQTTANNGGGQPKTPCSETSENGHMWGQSPGEDMDSSSMDMSDMMSSGY